MSSSANTSTRINFSSPELKDDLGILIILLPFPRANSGSSLTSKTSNRPWLVTAARYTVFSELGTIHGGNALTPSRTERHDLPLLAFVIVSPNRPRKPNPASEQKRTSVASLPITIPTNRLFSAILNLPVNGSP